MSFLRPQSSLKLSKTCTPLIRPLPPSQRRCLSRSASLRLGEPDPKAIPDVDAMQATIDQASIVELPERTPTIPSLPHSNQPDYNARTDHGTSTYSPVPRRVMDGSEDSETVPGAILSGAPIDLQARQVRIYKPVKPATQSGGWGGHAWRMDWDVLGKGHRWENPLMGWQSSADIMQGTHIKFRSKDEAVLFAEKQGYEYFVQEPNERRFVPKAYANNFIHEPKPLKHIKTK